MIRALIVEDSPDISGLLATTLSRQGYETEAASTGHAALDAARRLRPDLITLDLGLPDIDGLDVCRSLRSFTDAYILVVSARTDEVDKLAAFELGADGYLTKPFSPRELAAKAAALVRRPRSTATEETEEETAARVQRGLLPEQAPSLAGYDLAGACRPTRSVGGDFFDWESDGVSLAVSLADAMGKGMGAALVAATARAVLRPGRLTRSAAGLVKRAASTLDPDLLRLGSFLTLLHLRVDGPTGRVEYVDAGHGLGILVQPDGHWERVANSGPPLGLLPGAVWAEHELGLPPGGLFVMVSDGVLDAFPGMEEALDAVAAAAGAAPDAQAAVTAILDLGEGAEDDLTAVVLRRAGR